MYENCGCIKDAQVVFDVMPDQNVVCWGALIAGYVKFGKYKEALELFRQMQSARVTPDDATISSVISSCAQMDGCGGKTLHFIYEFTFLIRIYGPTNR